MADTAFSDASAGLAMVTAPREGSAFWPRQRVRLRTRPLALHAELGMAVDEHWQAACGDCPFAAATPSKPEIVLAAEQHVRTSGHSAPTVTVSFVVPHGRGRRSAVSRLTLGFSVRAT